MALAVDLAHRMQAAIGRQPTRTSRPDPVELAPMMRMGAPFAVGAEAAEHPGAEADVDRAGDDDLQRLAAALGVEDVEIEAVLLEDAGLLAELGDGAFPAAADRRGDLERFGGKRRRERASDNQRQHGKQSAFAHRVSPFCCRRSVFSTPSCPGLTRASIRNKAFRRGDGLPGQARQ